MRDGITWQAVPPVTVERPSFAYEAHPPAGATELGLLVEEEERLGFRLVAVE
jgi:hypothetical protein